jgi:hypothetical protein
MNGEFGRRDWLANGVLFAGYHLHMPWVIPTGLPDTFILSYPSKRYRSALIAIAVHSAQSILVLGLVLALVLKGCAPALGPAPPGSLWKQRFRTGRRIGGPFCAPHVV